MDRIAEALIEVSKSLDGIAKAIYSLGNGNAVTELGAIENLAKEIKEGFQGITEALCGEEEI